MTSDPDQIRDNIERTQANLSADVDALTDKVSPPRIVERRVQRTRYAMNSFKDRIMGTTSNASSSLGDTAGSAVGSVKDTAGSVKDTAGSAKDSLAGTAASARDTIADKASSVADAASSAPQQVRRQAQGNPLAAGLIAFGAGMLLSSLLPASEPEQHVAEQVKELATEKGKPIAQQLGQAGQEAAQELKESAQEKAQAVKETATDAASTVGDEAQSQASEVKDHAQQAGGRVSEQAKPN
jgi:gas vesicle protein